MAHAVGQMIGGRYEVKQVLIPGGQAEIYVVFDHNEQVTGVLKLIDLAQLPTGAGPWDEARVLRRLADDHILPILNADEIAGQPFIVTALAQHGTLETALQATSGLGLSTEEVITWIRQACIGVARAHDASLVTTTSSRAIFF